MKFQFTDLRNRLLVEIIKKQVAGSFDLSIFEGVKLYAGSDYKLIATITSLSSDEPSLKIEANNLLPLLQSTSLPIRLTTTTDKNIEGGKYVGSGAALYLLHQGRVVEISLQLYLSKIQML